MEVQPEAETEAESEAEECEEGEEPRALLFEHFLLVGCSREVSV
jgi:hypothetical protein